MLFFQTVRGPLLQLSLIPWQLFLLLQITKLMRKTAITYYETQYVNRELHITSIEIQLFSHLAFYQVLIDECRHATCYNIVSIGYSSSLKQMIVKKKEMCNHNENMSNRFTLLLIIILK